MRLRLESQSGVAVNAQSVSALNARLDALLLSLGAASTSLTPAPVANVVGADTIPRGDVRPATHPSLASVPDNTFIVRDGERVILLPLSELDWCEAADNYVRLHTKGKKHLIRETMRNVDERLASTRASNARFARIHRSMIVNLARVREIKPTGGGEYAVVLADGTNLALSRGYRERVMALLGFKEP
jgi:DNA-binding LytR/AlgR family response regulator